MIDILFRNGIYKSSEEAVRIRAASFYRQDSLTAS